MIKLLASIYSKESIILIFAARPTIRSVLLGNNTRDKRQWKIGDVTHYGMDEVGQRLTAMHTIYLKPFSV